MRTLILFALALPAFALPTCNAGSAATMPAGGSYTLDGSGSTGSSPTYFWTQLYVSPDGINGAPTIVTWSSHTTVNPTVSNIARGSYTFQLTVKDATGSATCNVSPVGVATGSTPVIVNVSRSFTLSGVTNAAKVRCSAMQWGGTVVTATTTTSPCTLGLDSTQGPVGTMPLKLEYLSAGDAVLATSDITYAPPSRHSPSMQYSAFMYATGHYGSDALKTAQSIWVPNHIDRVILCCGPWLDTRIGNAAKNQTLTYIESSYIYAGQLQTVMATATAQGWNYEDMFLHSSVDWTNNNGYNPWTNMDCFDAYDGGIGPVNCTAATNGVFKSTNFSTFTDITGSVYNGLTSTTLAAYTAIGLLEPFDQVNITITTGRTGGSAAWQYWNGSTWAALTLQSDGTSGMTTSGRVYFYPPSTWAKTSVNGSASKYWVRLVLTSPSVFPIITKIVGDDLRNGGSTTARGWNSTDPNRINVGLGALEYNPTPPAGASAKFRYQARLGGVFSTDNIIGNPANTQGGHLTWAQFLVDQIGSQLSNAPFLDGLMFDDAGGFPTSTLNPCDFSNQATPNTACQVQTTDAGVTTNTAYVGLITTMFDSVVASGHTNYPGSTIGLNTVQNTIAKHADWALAEQQLFGYSPDPPLATGYYLFMDNFCPVSGLYCPSAGTNSNNSVGVFGAFDNAFSWNPNLNTFDWYYMDRANRTPLNTLTSYYIGWNQNLGFSYSGLGPSYTVTDEAYVYGTATTLTADVDPNGWTIKEGTLTSIVTNGTTTATVNTVYPHHLTAGVNVVKLWGSLNATLGNGISYTVQSTPTTTSFTITLSSSVASTTFNSAPLSVTSDKAVALPLASAAVCEAGLHYRVHLGALGSGDLTSGTLAGSTITTSITGDGGDNLVYHHYASGDPAQCIQTVYMSLTGTPSFATVQSWGAWFPAINADLGIPDAAGYNGGNRDLSWKLGSAITNAPGMCNSLASYQLCAPIYRRDFTKGIILMRPYNSNWYERDIDVPSKQVCINATETYPACTTTYYPLQANGQTGTGATYAQLRAGEGQIWLKAPLP